VKFNFCNSFQLTVLIFLSQSLVVLFLQVRPNYRTAITIPERFWGRFRDILSDFIGASSAQPAVSDKPAENKAVVKEEVEADTAPAASPTAASSN